MAETANLELVGRIAGLSDITIRDWKRRGLILTHKKLPPGAPPLHHLGMAEAAEVFLMVALEARYNSLSRAAAFTKKWLPLLLDKLAGKKDSPSYIVEVWDFAAEDMQVWTVKDKDELGQLVAEFSDIEQLWVLNIAELAAEFLEPWLMATEGFDAFVERMRPAVLRRPVAEQSKIIERWQRRQEQLFPMSPAKLRKAAAKLGEMSAEDAALMRAVKAKRSQADKKADDDAA